MLEGALVSLFIGFLALVTSLFSMQVYDRVIPTQGESTLVVLTVGVMIGILIELGMKFARSSIMDRIAIGMDSVLSRDIFHRLLQLRVDQLPASVGGLTGQLRGYEQVRSFYTAGTLFVLVDFPIGVIFLFVIAFVASPYVAAVPLVMACLALAIGLASRRRVNRLAAEGAELSNMKMGLLVEAVEGVETIKAGSGGWKFLGRWIKLNSSTIKNDLRMRSSSETVNFLAAAIQQTSYAGVIVVGALVVMSGGMSMGALIACSILSGRVLAPIFTLPSLLVQHAHARAAISALDKLYQLKLDNDGVGRVLTPTKISGNYLLENVKFSYRDNPPALVVPRLSIRQGERIGVLGSIGSGKSTLLRVLSGLYAPEEGAVYLDGLDLNHISRQVLNRHVGYLQQEHRLFQGTLRENLLIGMSDPGDDVLLQVMKRTGMDRLVRSHPRGLDRAISEGGKGLSGGQRQLLAFTRLVLVDTPILLLDEPTANMDQEQERQCIAVMAEEIEKGKTIVIVTHKPSLLPLVNRLVVISGNQIALDGPRDEVLARLSSPIPRPSGGGVEMVAGSAKQRVAS